MTGRHDYPQFVDAKPAPLEQTVCSLCGGTGWRDSHVDELGGHGSRCIWCSGNGYYWAEVSDAS